MTAQGQERACAGSLARQVEHASIERDAFTLCLSQPVKRDAEIGNASTELEIFP